MIDEATGVIDVAMGNSSSKQAPPSAVTYDVGHVLGTFTGGGTSGLAYLGVVGDYDDYFSNDVGRRAGGGTVVGDINSVGTEGWTLVVAHELGHQFDAGHTFNASVAGTNCNANSINPSSAYEPASGSTIMSYAGICGANDLQSSEDPVFHSASFEDINTYIANSSTDPSYDATPSSTTSLGNAIPAVDAGTTYTIPAQTPFSLTAVGTDGDADPLTYSWEQLDLGSPQSLPISDLGSGPIFRAFAPTDDPTRIFPRLEDQLAGVNTAALGEVLPTTTRDLNFRATVRDGNGGVASDDVVVSVIGTAGPFAVTSQTTATTLAGGSTETVSWSVADTNIAPISVSDVAIELSVDGGLTFPYMLAASVPNTGSATVTLPNIDASSARVRVSANGNIFFDISNVDFPIAIDPFAPGINFTQSGSDTRVVESSVAGFDDSYQLALNTNPNGSVTIDVVADAQGAGQH